MEEIKVSVVIITYNQEKYISRAIESVLCQKEWVYEIIVSDDCSKDNNWEIIYSYVRKYPDLIKAYRNEHNLGIYGNMNAAYDRVTGNVISSLSADDEFASNYFSLVHQVIKKENVMGEAFLCYFDRYRKFTDNRPSYVFRNNMVTKYNPISLFIRGLICEYSFMSVKILERCRPSTTDGICADFLWGLSYISMSDKVIYYPAVSHIYNAGIGVSVLNRKKNLMSSIAIFDKIINENIYNVVDDKKNLYYLMFRREHEKSYIDHSIKSFFKASKMFFKSLTLKYGLKYMRCGEYFKYVYRFFFNYVKQ